MIDINSLDIYKATAVLSYCLSNNWHQKIGFKSWDEAYDVLGKLFCTNRNNIKNFRDAYDPFTNSGRQGWHQYTRDEIKPKYLRELLPELEGMNENDVVDLSKKIIQMIWLPDLEKIWDKIKSEAQNEKNRAELNLPDNLKELLLNFLKNERNYTIDDIGKTSIAVTTAQKQVRQVIPFSYIRHICIFKPFMQAVGIYHNVAKQEIIHPANQTEQDTYKNILDNVELPDFNKEKLNQINYEKFIFAIQNSDISGISKSIFRPKFDLITNIFCNKFNLENNKVGYVSSLLEFVLTSDLNLNEIDVSSNDVIVDNKTRNLILYGAPGTGKSYKIDKYVEKTNSTSYRTVFHSEYQNSDFVGSIKPTVIDNEISYVFKEGFY